MAIVQTAQAAGPEVFEKLALSSQPGIGKSGDRDIG